MPLEVEFKYILNFSGYDRDSWMNKAKDGKWNVEEIIQSYIGSDCRIRKIRTVVSKGKIVKKKRYHYVFTFKRKGVNALFPIEIQKNISKSDFEDLNGTSECSLTKTRYKWNTKHGEWAIDFLYDSNGKIYFALAEYECKCHSNIIYDIIPEIKHMIIHTVEPGDKRFTNRVFTNINYCTKLLKEINEGINEKHKNAEVSLSSVVP